MGSHRLTYFIDLTRALTIKELKAKYKTTTLGFLWIIINPLIQMLVLTLVFSFFLRISVPNYPLFIFAGLLPWVYFTLSVQTGTSSLVGNRDIIKKVPFPRELLPISSVFAHLYIFFFAFLILLFWSLVSQGFSLQLLFLIPLIILQTIMTIGISLLLSSFDIYFRDVSFALSAILLPWFYLTPIFYPITFIPEQFLPLYRLNPFVGITTSFQSILVDVRYFDITAIFITVIFTALISVIGYMTFKKRSDYFAEWI